MLMIVGSAPIGSPVSIKNSSRGGVPKGVYLNLKLKFLSDLLHIKMRFEFFTIGAKSNKNLSTQVDNNCFANHVSSLPFQILNHLNVWAPYGVSVDAKASEPAPFRNQNLKW